LDANDPVSHLHEINIDEPWERGYWSQRLGVAESDLRNAIAAVGPLVHDIKKFLQRE
jgi:hypothetical protein